MASDKGIFKLPREVRDQIYEEILDISIDPPSSPAEEEDDRREEDQGWGCMYYQRNLPSTNLEGLLGCSQRTRREVLDLIGEYGVRYKLDLMIWENSLQPTWLELPAPPKYVREVVVDIRMFDHHGPQWGETGILGQYLLQMLRRFLQLGPGFATDPLGRPDYRPLYPLQKPSLMIFFHAMDTKIDDETKEIVPRTPWTGNPREDPENCARLWLQHYISKFVKSGLLYGKIEKIRMWYKQKLHVWRIVDKGDRTRSAQRWDQYGWGPILQITQEFVDKGTLDYSEELDCDPPDAEEVMRLCREIEAINPDISFSY